MRKIAIVTGASRSKGIGAAICRHLAKAGVDIFFTHWISFDKTSGNGFDEDFPEQLKTTLEQEGVRVAHLQADLSKAETPQLIIETVIKELGPPTILINNATFEAPTSYQTLTRELLDQHYLVNNSGTIMLSTEFAKAYEVAYPGLKVGRIVNLVSKGPDPTNLAYTATKGMLIAVTEPLATGLAPIGITVNSIDPGPTDSGWMTEEIKDHLLPMFPSGRLGTPDDAARLVRFLVSDEGEWITGQLIRSEGGFLGK
ncbi:SDR family oxidoreductase [Mangrovibacillus cuniculi]|uniref:SDR family oxidoreductase n=1 Tax=Mangrovibacillus cuniculi TaxID=2593652 RepID=A0A7S8CCS7_9BACI|nr:SDR family oxidoreductase [Mangrovibacillus cuniculi]QPC47610.1 SDR family oxidoreductase [Mangrovibacillus cuniculi]